MRGVGPAHGGADGGHGLVGIRQAALGGVEALLLDQGLEAAAADLTDAVAGPRPAQAQVPGQGQTDRGQGEVLADEAADPGGAPIPGGTVGALGLGGIPQAIGDQAQGGGDGSPARWIPGRQGEPGRDPRTACRWPLSAPGAGEAVAMEGALANHGDHHLADPLPTGLDMGPGMGTQAGTGGMAAGRDAGRCEAQGADRLLLVAETAGIYQWLPVISPQPAGEVADREGDAEGRRRRCQAGIQGRFGKGIQARHVSTLRQVAGIRHPAHPAARCRLAGMTSPAHATATDPLASCLPRARALLERWAEAMEAWCFADAQGGTLFGFGGGQWGVQAAFRHAAACAVLAETGSSRAAHWRDRARGGLRCLLAAHVSGGGHLPGGGTWGRSWISALALERTWHGLDLLLPHLDADERAALDRVLADEAAWLCESYQRSGRSDIACTRWSHEGGNHGESNLWNGCLLWRAAERLSGDPRAGAWRERAHAFLLNGISVAADTGDDRIVAGKPLRERVTSPGFFDHFAFDHHGYLNVGYQVICLSHAAILHFDARIAGLAVPETLHHHQADLWDVVRRTVFADGRLARIGGDSRVRYAYCQEYLVPTALYAADHLGDGHALALVEGWLATAEREAAFSGDGSFYGRRLEWLATQSPSYWLRLESDRACALSMLLRYQPVLSTSAPAGDAEARLCGGWAEPEHGAVLHRSPTRLAAFAWRAHGLAQGTCQPPDDGNLAEWSGNLVGTVAFADLKPDQPRRKLIAHDQRSFAGGFLTWGRLALGCGCQHDEGWQAPATGQAVHHLAIAALPDERTQVAIEVVRVGAQPAIIRASAGLHLNLPNDGLNGCERTVITAAGPVILRAGEDEGLHDLRSAWAQVAPRLGVVGLHGGTTLAVDRCRERRGGPYRSLHVEEIVWGADQRSRRVPAGSDVLDLAWLVRSGTDAEDTARCATANPTAAMAVGPDARAIAVVLPDGNRWTLAVNLANREQALAGCSGGRVHAGAAVIDGDHLVLAPLGAALLSPG